MLALASVGAARPPTDPCAAPERAPRPSPECFASREGQRYVGELGASIGDALTGARSLRGKALLRVAFDGTASVASVCADGVEGEGVAQRLPGAIDRIHELPAAPACFALRRLDFAWESPELSAEQLRIAMRECRRRVEPQRRRNLYCLEMQRCSEREVIERWEQGDRELRACLLEKLPLETR